MGAVTAKKKHTTSAKPANAGQQEAEALRQELAAVRQEAERLKELAARAQADLQNARGRMEREAQDIRSYALEGMLRKLLPTVDNFKRAFAHLPPELQGHDWVKGLQGVEQALLKGLADSGLRQFPSLHERADSAKHEVLQAGPGPKDTVIEVFEEGYLLHEKILRPAKVKVGDGTGAAAPSGVPAT